MKAKRTRRSTRNVVVDEHVGQRVRLRRTMLGMSQERLGAAIGLTFQQVQKYERGANRIGASRLYELAEVLDVPPSFFFDDMPTDGLPGEAPAGAKTGAAVEVGRKELELVRNFQAIGDKRSRNSAYALIAAMARAGDAGEEAGR
jgi:transcriptional regulator with XRE-family HTH domain